MNTSIYTCIIIDDEFHCRQLLENKINRSTKDLVVLENFSGIREALSYLSKNIAPDIIFLDLEMQDENGFEFLSILEGITSQIIITSAYEKYALKTIKFHVADFLLKPVDDSELSATFEYVKTKILKTDIFNISMLTSKESKVLHLVARGLLNKEIAADLRISQNTVKNHLQHIFKKLKVQNRSEAILYLFKKQNS